MSEIFARKKLWFQKICEIWGINFRGWGSIFVVCNISVHFSLSLNHTKTIFTVKHGTFPLKSHICSIVYALRTVWQKKWMHPLINQPRMTGNSLKLRMTGNSLRLGMTGNSLKLWMTGNSLKLRMTGNSLKSRMKEEF